MEDVIIDSASLLLSREKNHYTLYEIESKVTFLNVQWTYAKLNFASKHLSQITTLTWRSRIFEDLHFVNFLKVLLCQSLKVDILPIF